MKKPYVYTLCTLYIFRVCFLFIFLPLYLCFTSIKNNLIKYVYLQTILEMYYCNEPLDKDK